MAVHVCEGPGEGKVVLRELATHRASQSRSGSLLAAVLVAFSLAVSGRQLVARSVGQTSDGQGMTATLRIAGDPDTILDALFFVDDDGLLRFGGAWVRQPSSLSDLEAQVVTFNEIVLEAQIRYGLRIARRDDGIDLVVSLLGSSRDESLVGWIGSCVRRKGLVVE